MGLCKCPKRKATNLFCFEHRVNVCEDCLVDVHESCVVQTYLAWLTDSDYDTKCLLCSEALNSKETIRLKCLHNFHWSCLSSRVGNLPEGTPAGAFKCPSCLDTIFPAPNQTSPVVERLKQKLSTVNWARVGLGLESKPGLDVVTESVYPKKSFTVDMSFESQNNSQATCKVLFYHLKNCRSARVKQVLSPTTYPPQPVHNNDSDHNELKYVKRQSSFRLRLSRVPRTVKRVAGVVIILLGFYLLLVWVGSDTSTVNDRLFDPHANPNIRVESNHL